MNEHATSELRYIKRLISIEIKEGYFGNEIKLILQQRWKFDDSSDAGWKDVPIVLS